MQKLKKMGRIKRFNLGKLSNLINAEFFFETGTWKGDGLAFAAKYPFKNLLSSEIIPSIAEKATARFKEDKRIRIINDSSIDSLKNNISKITGNCIFWLDAHFPGAEEGLSDYNETSNEDLKLPLQKELEIIASRKNRYNDIILIDDLRIYETGDFESGNLPENVLPPQVRGIDFATRLFGDSHEIIKSYRDEGYLLMIPKKISSVNWLKTLRFNIENRIFKRII